MRRLVLVWLFLTRLLSAQDRVVGVVEGIPQQDMNAALRSILEVRPIRPKIAPPERVRVSARVSHDLLTHSVAPIYPPNAREARIQGSVLFGVVIAKDGTIKELKVISGPTALVDSAATSVRQWRFRPYTLNGNPVEVETQVTVNFVLH